MARKKHRDRELKERSAAAWRLAAAQHGVVTRGQLLKLGFSRGAIAHRLACGRLHRLHAGVYAVGRPEVSEQGQLMAAVLACGDDAVLSHSSAAGLMRIGRKPSGLIEVSIRTPSPVRRPGLVVHRRPSLRCEHTGTFEGIPVTSPVQTLIDVTPRLDRPGVARLRWILDRRTFRLTREELERRFLPLAREAGLPVPQTRRIVNGFEVDFFWPALGFVVETDGLRYHRTPAEQARDRLRDQAHTAAGYAHLRFTHEQVRYEPEHVRATLAATARLLPAPVARSAAVGPAASPA